MFIWFTMLAVLGMVHLSDDLAIFKALSPHYAIEFLKKLSGWVLATGSRISMYYRGRSTYTAILAIVAEDNIRISWIYVKICLLINYFGQGAYLLAHHTGLEITAEVKKSMGINAFYDLMPEWFIIAGVIIATTAAIIASQAMVSGAFTLISEAMRLKSVAESQDPLSI